MTNLPPIHLPCVGSPPQLHAGLLGQRLGSYSAVKNGMKAAGLPGECRLFTEIMEKSRQGPALHLSSAPAQHLICSQPGCPHKRPLPRKATSASSSKTITEQVVAALGKSGISHLRTGCCVINSRLHSAVIKSINVRARLLRQFQLITTATSFATLGKLFNCSASAKQGLTIAPTS